MRRALIILCVTLGLSVPAVALAGDAADDGTLSIRYGRGLAQLWVKHGAVIGRLGKGWVKVDDRVETDTTRIDFWGCERTRDIDENTTVCSGTDLRFRVVGDSYRTVVSGRGMFLSAVGRGQVTLDGAGNPDTGIYRDGVFSFNGDPYESLPNGAKSYPLAPPASGG